MTTIATTRIIAMHRNRGKTIAQCIGERTDYAKNSDKTKSGELISSYACDPHTVEAEFMLSKNRYKTITGREEKNDVIAYQVRQAFKPGEVTAEEANRIGYEFASRFLKGKHAFIVCTHVDKKHIHNHIIWNSTTLDCTRKFRDFRGSGKAVARLSDIICTEHQLSVITNPRLGNNSYDKWLGNKAKLSNREKVRIAIDEILAKNPRDFDTFLSMLGAEGYTVKRGKYLTLAHTDFKKNIRMSSLGDGYTEDEIRAVIAGKKKHTRIKRKAPRSATRPQTLIDISAKLAEGKGEGYRRWATVENLKRMARTKLFVDEHGFDYTSICEKHRALSTTETELKEKIDKSQKRLAEIGVLKTHIINYSKTRKVYIGYRKAGYSKKYLAQHEDDIIIHKAAKKAFDELGVKKIPTVKQLGVEFADVMREKKDAYAGLKRIRDELHELAVHKAIFEELRDIAEHDRSEEKRRERDKRSRQ